LPELDDLPRRRLTDEERRALRERRLAALSPLPDEVENPPPYYVPAEPTGHDRPVQRRERLPGGEALVPPTRLRDRASARTVTLGALLFIGILAVTFGAGGLLGSADDNPTPTPTPAPTVLAPFGPVAETPTSSASPAPVAAGFVASGRPVQARWPGEGDGRAVVCLDPGHGGSDLGYTRLAAAGQPAMAEADYNLAHAYDLADRLRADGFAVVMTRRTPNAVNAAGADVNGDGRTIADSERAGELDELQARIDICNEAGADLLVSMHVNGYDQPSLTARGYETWYTGGRPYGELSGRFANLIYDALGEEMGAAGYQAVGREINNDDEISVDESDPVLFDHMIMTGPDVPGMIRASEMPAAIVECLFISDDADAAFLATEVGHDAIVSAYEAAIVEYFTEYPG
jgi:N-acetylmuramoyl-L-alanine amidase